MLRVEHIFVGVTLGANGVFAHQEIGSQVMRIDVIGVRHSLVRIGIILKMPGTGITRRLCTRMSHEIAFAVLHERDRHVDTSFVFGLRIEDQRVLAISVRIGKSEHIAGLIPRTVSVGRIRLGVPSAEIITVNQKMILYHCCIFTGYRVCCRNIGAEMPVVIVADILVGLRLYELQTTVLRTLIDIDTRPTGHAAGNLMFRVTGQRYRVTHNILAPSLYILTRIGIAVIRLCI